MNGKVEVKSILKKGSRFIVTLSLPVVDTYVLRQEHASMSQDQKREALRKLGAFDFASTFNQKFKEVPVNQVRSLDSLNSDRAHVTEPYDPLRIQLERQVRTFQFVSIKEQEIKEGSNVK